MTEDRDSHPELLSRRSRIWTLAPILIALFVAAWGVFEWVLPPLYLRPDPQPVRIVYADGEPATDLVLCTDDGQAHFPNARGQVWVPIETFGSVVSVQTRDTWVELWSVKLVQFEDRSTTITVPYDGTRSSRP